MDWNAQYTYNFPTTIRFGKDVIKELGPHLKQQGFTKLFIVTDPTLSELGFFKNIISDLKSQGLHPEIFHDIHKNPVKSDVLAGVAHFQRTACQAVVGIGGGASLDVARAIVLKVNHPGDLFDYEDGKGGDRLVTKETPYFVTVPTTAGTGSEVGRSAVISDDVTHQKKILFSPRLMAKIAFADPGLTMELPSPVTAATGMDALTHNVEAYLSKGFHPMCDGIALEGIRLIGESLVRAVKQPDLESRSKMMMAAIMGAAAFQKGLGVVHSLAHPLSTMFDLHHGLANAMMLQYGMRFNADACADRMKKISEVLGLENPGPDAFVTYLGRLNQEINVPQRLSSQGVQEKDIEPLSKLAREDVCHACNLKPVTQNDFRKIYRSAL